MTNLKTNGLSFSKPLTKEQIENHKRMVADGEKPGKEYSESEMIIQPDDNEDWIVPGYNHGHKAGDNNE